MIAAEKNNRLVICLKPDIILRAGSLHDDICKVLGGYSGKDVAFDISDLNMLDDLSLTTIMKLVDKYSQKGYRFYMLDPVKEVLKNLVYKDVLSKVSIEFTDYKGPCE